MKLIRFLLLTMEECDADFFFSIVAVTASVCGFYCVPSE